MNVLAPAVRSMRLTALSAAFAAAGVPFAAVQVGQAQTAAPTCSDTVSVGPTEQVVFTFQASRGLQSPHFTVVNPASIDLPTITPGTTAPVVVTVTKIDPTQTLDVTWW